MPSLAIALETSTRPASIALSVDGGEPKLILLDGERSHASDLLPLLSGAVTDAGGVAADIEMIVVGTGPGSYTGLRVGCSTALGLGLGLSGDGAGPRLVGVPSFEALAFGALAPGERAAVVRNAYGGSLYLASYGRSQEGLIVFQEPVCVPKAETAEILSAEAIWLADEGALKAIGDTVLAAQDIRKQDPMASSLLGLAMAKDDGTLPHGPDAIKPLYLRPFEVKVRTR